VIDASALTVMPGLWDPHIHPLTLYQGGQYGQIAALMLSYGITSTQSVAGPLHQSIEIREALEAGNLLGPRLFVSPPLWEGNRQFYSFARTLKKPAWNSGWVPCPRKAPLSSICRFVLLDATGPRVLKVLPLLLAMVIP